MKIKLLYQQTPVYLETSVERDPDEPATLSVSFDEDEDPSVVEFVRSRLMRELGEASGFYGHGIDLEALNNLDLDDACRDLPSFNFVSAEPEIILNPIPDGAKS